jgi:hypothetical protein
MHDDAPQAPSGLRAEVERPRSPLDRIVPAVIAATAIVMTALVVTNGRHDDARSTASIPSAAQAPARAAPPAPSPSPAPSPAQPEESAPRAAPAAKSAPAPRAQARTAARAQVAKPADAKAAAAASPALEPLPDFPIPGEPKN